ncbi:ABC transporter ATP-binding protein [Roseibium polysiphoniae]|uniref:ABC transporter ATP-binding protein n=1 Tax=Roseibium polysiphoniae TaxID=2571221 RepID=A0ABR9CGW7_9HYPH|nr:ABC transporter ATP-binding protein [Roseibium polysiphoniae]MBD8878272.1 ABC transporter ATP-binding protein [Roseibium polysiphoniae]
MSTSSLLAVDSLVVSIKARGGDVVYPVRSASFALERGQTLALVGESGCGKSMTCLAISGLLPKRGAISHGRVVLDGLDLADQNPKAMRNIRRKQIAFVFQDAVNGLNPVKTIGWQIAEAVALREDVSWHRAKSRALDLLDRVGMPDPKTRVREFPHQLSGGMNQRAMIALAVAGQPKLLIADEATTALDVTIQAQILALIADLQREFGMAVIFVTHDLGLVAEMADAVAVMYAGRVVERAPVAELYAAPKHPYTAGLLNSLPRVDRRRETIQVIEGQVPPINAMPSGCAFGPRCGLATDECRTTSPNLVLASGGALACHHPLTGTPL